MFVKRQAQAIRATEGRARLTSTPHGSDRLFGSQSVRALVQDEAGGTAIIYAFALIPLLGFAGLALDYSRGSLGQVRLQSALDSAGLSVGQLPPDTPVAEVEQRARDWVRIALAGKGLDDINLSASIIGERIRLVADSKVDMTLSRVIRTDPFHISAATEIVWNKDKFEIALVLDNSNSMTEKPNGDEETDAAKQKLTRLKEAATSLTNYLEKRIPSDRLKISIVPFSGLVNVGKEYKDAPWIDREGLSPLNKEIFDEEKVSRLTLFNNMGVEWGGCVESRPMQIGGVTVNYDIRDTPPNSAYPETLFVPFFRPDLPDEDWAEKYQEETGIQLITDDYDDKDDYLPDQINSNDWEARKRNRHKYVDVGNHWATWGPNNGCREAPILRLTSNMDDVRNRLGQMVGVGSTNINMGLMWGWHLLSPQGPFADGAPYTTPNLHKIVILMTDGQNSYENSDSIEESRYLAYGFWKSGRIGGSAGETSKQRTARMDARMGLLCTEMKNSGIEIYTIRVEYEVGIDTDLRNCASEDDDGVLYYDVKDSAQLGEVFIDIAKKITQLRIAK